MKVGYGENRKPALQRELTPTTGGFWVAQFHEIGGLMNRRSQTSTWKFLLSRCPFSLAEARVFPLIDG
jgi:hypothetical protein